MLTSIRGALCRFALIVVAAFAVHRASAQILLTVDISDPAAITVSGTGAVAAVNYTGTATTFPVRLLNFFTSNPGQENPLAATSSTLSTNGGPILGQFMAGRASPGVTTFVMRNAPNTAASYSTSAAAFTGTAVFNFTSFAGSFYVDYLPSVGHIGNIVGSDGATVVGTYSVVSSVPEPAAFALLGGIAVLGAVILRRRPRVVLV